VEADGTLVLEDRASIKNDIRSFYGDKVGTGGGEFTMKGGAISGNILTG
jgi:hypothetical protein